MRHIEASTDRVTYEMAAGDSTAPVQLTIRNQSERRIYLQTAEGQADVLILVLVKSAGPDAWSLFRDCEAEPQPGIHGVTLDPDSTHRSGYRLPRGEYRILVVYGEKPSDLHEHGVWVEQFSVQ